MSGPAMGYYMQNPLKRSADSVTHEPIAELTRVVLAAPVRTENGVLPSGTMGTVVGVYRHGAAYEVEFTRPFHAVATVMPDAIRK